MKYEYVFTRAAVKDIEKLDTVIKKRIKQKLEFFILQSDPLLVAKKLVNAKAGTYRWRVGDYRILFDIDKDKIIILQVRHRKNIYR